MFDAIQESAIELTEMASGLQALAFKRANQIAEVLTMDRPLIRKLPVIGQAADSEAMVRVEDLSRTIVTTTANARKVIKDLQQALIEVNPKYLKRHLEDLRRYRGEVNELLAGSVY